MLGCVAIGEADGRGAGGGVGYRVEVSWSLAVTRPAGRLAGAGMHTPLCRGRGVWKLAASSAPRRGRARTAGPNPTAPHGLRAKRTDQDKHLTLRAKA